MLRRVTFLRDHWSSVFEKRYRKVRFGVKETSWEKGERHVLKSKSLCHLKKPPSPPTHHTLPLPSSVVLNGPFFRPKYRSNKPVIETTIGGKGQDTDSV